MGPLAWCSIYIANPYPSHGKSITFVMVVARFFAPIYWGLFFLVFFVLSCAFSLSPGADTQAPFLQPSDLLPHISILPLVLGYL